MKELDQDWTVIELNRTLCVYVYMCLCICVCTGVRVCVPVCILVHLGV